MKKYLLIIAVVFLNLQAIANDKVLEYKSSNLSIGMYEYNHTNSLKLNLSISKDKGEKTSIKLMDATGRTLHEEVIGKKLEAVSIRIDLSVAPLGKYYVEVKSGDRIITKEVVRNQSTLSY